MSPGESNSDRLSLRLQGSGAICVATRAARAFGESQSLGGDDLARLCIVVEELIANIYDHGGVTSADEVQIELTRDARSISLSIVDPGTPFNPWSAPPSAERTGRGGAGLSLIRAWAKLISYRSSSDSNHLELTLPIGGQTDRGDA